MIDTTTPSPAEPATTRPHLTIVPPSTPAAPGDATDTVGALPALPDIDLESLPDDTEGRKTLPKLPSDDELGIYGPPPIWGNLGLDTEFTAQPHWLNEPKGEPFTFRLHPGLARLVTILVESSATPYQSKSEFFRDAAYYLARTIRDLINNKDQRLETILREANLRAQSDDEARLQDTVLAFEHNLTEAVIGCIERGALAEACRKVDLFWTLIADIPVPYHRKAHQNVILESPLIQAILTLGQSKGYPVPVAAVSATQVAQPAV